MRGLLLFMGFVLTSGFFAHDVHYTIKFIGIGLASLVFLAGLFWFHILVFLKESGLAVVNSAKARNTIQQLRKIIFILTILASIAEHSGGKEGDNFMSAKNLAESGVSFVLIFFPEVVFRLLFCLKKKNAVNKESRNKSQKKTAVINQTNSIKAQPYAELPPVRTPEDTIVRTRS